MPRLGHDTILGGKTTSDKFHHPVSQSNKCFPIVLPPLKLSKNHHSSNYNSWSRSFLLKSAILLKTYARLDIGDQVYFLTTRLLHSSLNFFIVSALCVCGSGSRRVVRRALLLLLLVVEEQQGLATCNNLHLLSVQLLSSSLFFPWYLTTQPRSLQACLITKILMEPSCWSSHTLMICSRPLNITFT